MDVRPKIWNLSRMWKKYDNKDDFSRFKIVFKVLIRNGQVDFFYKFVFSHYNFKCL